MFVSIYVIKTLSRLAKATLKSNLMVFTVVLVLISFKNWKHILADTEHNLEKKPNSSIILRNFEQCQEHNMLILRAQSTKA